MTLKRVFSYHSVVANVDHLHRAAMVEVELTRSR